MVVNDKLTVVRYKLTDQNNKTYGGTHWGPGAQFTTTGKGNLCGPGWLHCYSDPILAAFLNPIHANFTNPRLCEVECSGQSLQDKGLKEGWTTMSFIRWIDYSTPSQTQRIAFSILCAKEVYKEKAWTTWADNWLTNIDRSSNAADAADAAAYAAANAAAAAYANAAYAANAANAAYAAANAAYSAYSAYSAAAAQAAAQAAAYSAQAAAAQAATSLDLIAIVHKAMEY